MTALPVPLLSPRLAALPFVRHGFFSRDGGASRGVHAGLNVGLGSDDDAGAVSENRRRAAAVFGLSEGDLVTCRQVHSSVVHDADKETPWSRPEGDGMISHRPARLLGVLSADCAPVLFASPHTGAVAAVHAGWRGALGGVLERAVEALSARGAAPRDLVAAVGPCIGPASYEVGAEFEERFRLEDPRAGGFFQPAAAAEKRLFDLPGYVLDRLLRAGVENAHWIGRDTYAEPDRFYSYRRAQHAGEADYGRLLSAIVVA